MSIRLEIWERARFADGHAFGEVGSYEILSGRAHMLIDPGSVPEGTVADLELAPRTPLGGIAIEADFTILKPADLARGNRRLLFDYGNRGNKRALQFFNDAPHSNRPRDLRHAGNGFLMRRGYTVVWLGWQGDLLPGDGRLLLDLPVALQDGRPVTGPVRADFIADEPGTRSYPLSGRVNTRSHTAVSTDTKTARLTRRRYPDSEPMTVAADEWAFAREEKGLGLDSQGGEEAVLASDTHVHLPRGFVPGWIYEVEYEGRGPLVLGLGHVAVRDFCGFLKHADEAAGNPLRSGDVGIDRSYAWGRSQTGRCIRDFIYLGFNADASGRRVFDGMLPHVAGAGRMDMGRFANLTYGGATQFEDRETGTDLFPFAYAATVDPRSGREDAILKRPETDPLVIHTQSSTEYWQRRGSLVHTDREGHALPEHAMARIYHWASTQHYSDPNLPQPKKGLAANYENNVQTSFLFRALLDALDRWASEGLPPPPSRVPRREDGELGTVSQWRAGFPAIPGMLLPKRCNDWVVWERQAEGRAARGRARRDEADQAAFQVLVPMTDADGNELGGIRPPMVAAPLGTYTGWNTRPRGHGHGALHSLSGSYIPFSETPDVTRSIGDPRPSVLERYPTPAAYVASIEAAARRLIAEGFMLDEDLAPTLALAEDWGRPRHEVLL